MTVTKTRTEVTAVVETVGSHFLSTQHTGGRGGGPFTKEECFPVVVFENVPRLGTVRAQFSADRYEHSSYDEGSNTSRQVMGDWRIYMRQVTEPEHGKGIGDSTRHLLNEAGEPVIRAWLASDAYTVSRKRTAAYAVAREIQDSRYSRDRAAELVQRVNAQGDLTPRALGAFTKALKALSLYDDAMEQATAQE